MEPYVETNAIGQTFGRLSGIVFTVALISFDPLAAVADDGASAQPVRNTYAPAEFAACVSQPYHMPQDTSAVLGATVLVVTSTGFGSGVMLSQDGLVLTAAHVISGGPIKVVFQDRREAIAELIRIDSSSDVALLKVAGVGFPCMEISQRSPQIGDAVYVIGSPASRELSFSLSAGIVSALREWNNVSFLQTDASLNPGNSGGPMLDTDGRLIAIVSWKLAGIGVEGVGFGVPVDAVLGSLALKPGARTDAALTVRLQSPPSEPVQASVGTTGGPVQYQAQTAATTFEPAKTPLALHLARWGGLAVAGVGAAMTIITYSMAKGGTTKDYPELTYKEFNRLETINLAGWITIGVGAALFATSLVITLVRWLKARKMAGLQFARGLSIELSLDQRMLAVRF